MTDDMSAGPGAGAVQIDPEVLERYLMELAAFGAWGETGVSRLVYSPAWQAAQQQIMAWGATLGCETRMDASGNVWCRLVGSEDGSSVATGSHVDSQDPGGRYDGALGVVAGLTALQALVAQHGRPRRTIELVSFAEEESSRFASAQFLGTRGITGAITPADADAMIGYDGVTLADAMRAAGLDPARIPEAQRQPGEIDTFIELHIEQGPILEQSGYAVGIVDAITGLRHTVVELTGRSDHAGARPMDTRLDPMAGAAEIISGLINHAVALGRPAVTTVGRMFVEPNLTAAVPDRVQFTIDARHPDPAQRLALYAHHDALVARVAEEHGLGLQMETVAAHEPRLSDPGVVALLEATASDLGMAVLRMQSGAVHDTQRMARIAKVAMIFVQSRDGRSHTPEEFTSLEHAAAGTQVLANALYRLAY